MALSPMYPPRDKLPEEQAKPSQPVSFVGHGFMWVALGGLVLLSHRVSLAVIYFATAVGFWIRAWATRAGFTQRKALLIGISAYAALLVVGYFAGYLRW